MANDVISLDSLGSELERGFTIRDDDGMTIVLVGLLATLYFENGSERGARDQVAQAIAEYRSKTVDNLRWAKDPETMVWKPAESTELPDIAAWLRNRDPDMPWELKFKGGEDPESASDFFVGGFGPGRWQKLPSYFKVVLPITWFADHEGSFPEYVLSLCRLLQPMHGYGGLGIIESPNDVIASQAEPIVYRLAQRFPGLEVDYPVTHLMYAAQGIKGVDWLTMLGDAWLDRLGGVQALRASLTDRFTLDEYPGGQMIRAGRAPELGDSEKGMFPSTYVTLASLLKPIRMPNHRSFHHVGPNRFTRETSEEWLARFD